MKKNTKKDTEKTYRESEVLTMLESINDNLKIAIKRMKAANNLNKRKYDFLKNSE